MTSRLVPMGVFGAAHGIKGELRLKSYTEEPLAILRYRPLTGGNGQTFELLSGRLLKDDMLVVRVKGVDDRNAAERLTNIGLLAPREVLGAAVAEDEFLHADLIGLQAETVLGTPLGTVTGLYDFGAGDLVEVKPAEGGQPVLYPFTKAVVPVVDIRGGRIVVVPPVEIDNEADETPEPRPSPQQAGRRRGL